MYDGWVRGQSWSNSVYRCGRDCLQHEYYSQEWNQSFMPLISKMRNVLVTETTHFTTYIDELAIRLLDIATNVFDSKLDLDHRGHATMSLVTMGCGYFSAFCHLKHKNLKDGSKELSTACRDRLLHLPEPCDPNFKFKMYQKPKGDYEKTRMDYVMRFINEVGVGMPMTCAYYLHKDTLDDENDCFVQYFMESGLGLQIIWSIRRDSFLGVM